MWDVIKNAVTQVKDALGIEMPELPVELGSLDATGLGEAATTAAEGVTTSTVSADGSTPSSRSRVELQTW